MRGNSFLPPGLILNAGDSVHTSSHDPYPHLTGRLDGKTVHVPYYGQTTLGMFDRNLPGHRLGDLAELHDRFPSTFRDSGFGKPR